MEIKKDAYREQQVRTMLAHMSGNPDKDYPANLSHCSPNAKPICVESDALNLLADAYAGKYIEVNSPQSSPHTGVNLDALPVRGRELPPLLRTAARADQCEYCPAPEQFRPDVWEYKPGDNRLGPGVSAAYPDAGA